MRPDDVMPPSAVLDVEPFSDDDVALYFDNVEAIHGEGNFTGESIDDYLAASSPVARWSITDDDQAEWAARKLAAATAAMREIDMRADDYIARINAWRYECSRSDQRTVDVMRGKLLDYALRERVEHGRATVKLPSAEIGTTASAPKAVVDDDETLAAYLDARLCRPPANASDEGLARWRAWWDAVEAAKESDESLVKRSAKVYVSPLRKIVELAEREIGYEALCVLDCEHESVLVNFTGLDDPNVPSIGATFWCGECEATTRTADVTVRPVVEHVVVGPDGEIVPGCSIDPGGVTPKEIKLR